MIDVLRAFDLESTGHTPRRYLRGLSEWGPIRINQYVCVRTQTFVNAKVCSYFACKGNKFLTLSNLNSALRVHAFLAATNELIVFSVVCGKVGLFSAVRISHVSLNFVMVLQTDDTQNKFHNLFKFFAASSTSRTLTFPDQSCPQLRNGKPSLPLSP